MEIPEDQLYQLERGRVWGVRDAQGRFRYFTTKEESDAVWKLLLEEEQRREEAKR